MYGMIGEVVFLGGGSKVEVSEPHTCVLGISSQSTRFFPIINFDSGFGFSQRLLVQDEDVREL